MLHVTLELIDKFDLEIDLRTEQALVHYANSACSHFQLLYFFWHLLRQSKLILVANYKSNRKHPSIVTTQLWPLFFILTRRNGRKKRLTLQRVAAWFISTLFQFNKKSIACNKIQKQIKKFHLVLFS